MEVRCRGSLALLLQSLQEGRAYRPCASLVSGDAATSGGALRGLDVDLGEGVVAARGLPDRLECVVELRAVRWRDALEQLFLHLVHDLGGVLDDGQALLGNLDDVTAAI